MSDEINPSETLDLNPEGEEGCDCGHCEECYAFNVMTYGVKQADEIFRHFAAPGQTKPTKRN